MKMTRKKLNKSEKGLLLGFASNLLSEMTHNHIVNFMELEAGLSRKYFLPPLLEVASKFNDAKFDTQNSNEDVDEIILSDNENEVNFSGQVLSLPSLLDCDDDTFFLMFHLKKSSLEALEEALSSLAVETSTFQAVLPELSLQHKILMTVWILSNQQPYKEAAQMFSISVTDCEACFISICETFTNNIKKYVMWPSAEEAEGIAAAIDGQYGFPGVIGILGSASIKATYSNQISKGGCCILQIVSDHNIMIRDAIVGPAGMDSVSGVFVNSSLYKGLISKKKPLMSAFEHVIGSEQYPQLANLLTPYRGEELTTEEEQFNSMHECVRKNVDRCFNALVTRFNRLQSIVCSDVDNINSIVLATCFLHNFLLQQGDSIEPI